MIDTCVAAATAASVNRIARLIRSSTANFRRSETRCTRRRSPDLLERSQQEDTAATAQPITAAAPSAARPALAWVDDQRQRDDADGVGDRDLRQQFEHRRAGQAQRVDDRQDQGRRRGRHQDRIERRMSGIEQRRRQPKPSDGRDSPDGNRSEKRRSRIAATKDARRGPGRATRRRT